MAALRLAAATSSRRAKKPRSRCLSRSRFRCDSSPAPSRKVCLRNVKRWRDAKMIERWTAAGMLEAEKRFYRAQGFRDIPAPQAALRSCLKEVIGSEEEVA